MTDWFAKVPPRVAISIAPVRQEGGWARPAKVIAGLSLFLWAFVAALLWAML